MAGGTSDDFAEQSRDAYQPEFRRRISGVCRAGPTPEELVRDFEPTAPAIRN